MAPDRVRGGKNSKEKNLSLDSILDLILSIRGLSKVLKKVGEADLEVSGLLELVDMASNSRWPWPLKSMGL